MSEAVVVDIPSLIRRQSQVQSHHQSNCFIKRCHLPEHYYPQYLQNSRNQLRHPNQPISSPSSVSSSSPASPSSPSSSLSNSYDFENDESSAAISVDGEFDVRIDIIQQSSKSPISNITRPDVVVNVNMTTKMSASAPPLSDYENEDEESESESEGRVVLQKPQGDIQHQEYQEEKKQEEEVCVCVICYESFEQPVELELLRGRNYTLEELEDIEGNEQISNFCQTCKYSVHHKCIDEYRLNKVIEIIRSGQNPQQNIIGQRIIGTFVMKCLMCAREVEQIHISRNGEIDIVKTQPETNNQGHHQEQEQQQQQQQQQIEEIIQNRIRNRMRRRQRFQLCKNKICSICFMLLVIVTLLVFIFRMI